MLNVVWDENHYGAISDKRIMSEIDYAISQNRADKEYMFFTPQELVLQGFVLAVVEKRISHDQIVFWYNQELIRINEFGVLDKWPFPSASWHMTVETAKRSIQLRSEKANVR